MSDYYKKYMETRKAIDLPAKPWEELSLPQKMRYARSPDQHDEVRLLLADFLERVSEPMANLVCSVCNKEVFQFLKGSTVRFRHACPPARKTGKPTRKRRAK